MTDETTGVEAEEELPSDVEADVSAGEAESPRAEVPLGSVDDIEVELRCDVGSKSFRLSELSSLNPGFVIELETLVEQPVRLSVNGQVVGTGELLQINGKLAVRVIERVSP